MLPPQIVEGEYSFCNILFDLRPPAIGDKGTVIFDSGIRTAADIFKAIPSFFHLHIPC